ncbi:hypothetical protein H1S01_18965 [Heliobacterium chlorum]|uniref:Uncharacterized protein n=1 Tax=Heliobacterium chlorum TaxID=2698 RepID=A0ABR7T825_HELCL|nr:hypothetical protein [Heliobacterium chlorum]MBC9786540.1 hypothetical protein [Heliobacterium chlorum]
MELLGNFKHDKKMNEKFANDLEYFLEQIESAGIRVPESVQEHLKKTLEGAKESSRWFEDLIEFHSKSLH